VSRQRNPSPGDHSISIPPLTLFRTGPQIYFEARLADVRRRNHGLSQSRSFERRRIFPHGNQKLLARPFGLESESYVEFSAKTLLHCRIFSLSGMNQSEDVPRTEALQKVHSAHVQLVTRRVDELRPLPSYVKYGLSVPSWKIGALDRLGDRVFQDPIVVTEDGLVIDGSARLALAKRRGIETILCLVYRWTEDEALREFLWRHRRVDGLNDFILIELSRDLHLINAEKARRNQQAGGQRKGSAKLEASERVDSRKERAQILGVSEGNVGKVDRILDYACSLTKQAARDKEISIHKAEKWSRQTEAQQIENLRVLRIEQGIRKKRETLLRVWRRIPTKVY
jgi:hypothetical protein